jgi:hypothetical protein
MYNKSGKSDNNKQTHPQTTPKNQPQNKNNHPTKQHQQNNTNKTKFTKTPPNTFLLVGFCSHTPLFQYQKICV